MHEDEHVVVTNTGGSGVATGLIAGLLIVILIIVIIWWFGFGPGVAPASPGINVNVNLPTAVPSP